jgi:prevent-host-death family protein
MTEINVAEAAAQLSELLDSAAAGETIVIMKDGKPVAKLVPHQPLLRKKRIGGQNLLGIIYIADDFDAPLPPEIQRYFDGEGEIFPDAEPK